MAQRSYHPLAKIAFAAVALLTLLTLTLHGHGHHSSTDTHKPSNPAKTYLRTETFEFPH